MWRLGSATTRSSGTGDGSDTVDGQTVPTMVFNGARPPRFRSAANGV
jgi:hypothetical protein